MDVYQGGPAVPAPAGRSGSNVAVAVLLWVFVGWPLSWLLLFAFVPLGILFGVGITVWLIVYLATSSRGSPAVVVNIGTGPPAHQAVRAQVEGLAHINAVGGCGWCGSPSAHVNDVGYPVHPRHWHAAEIEERIRSKTQG